jgi:hypothetical protein
MKYDEKQNKIFVSVREIVRIARRGISQVLPFDEDEPYGEAGSVIKRELLIKSEESLCEEFSTSGYNFVLSVKCMICEDGALCVPFVCDRTPHNPSRESVSVARGKAFIIGYAYLMQAKRSCCAVKIAYTDTSGDFVSVKEETLTLKNARKFFEKCLVSLTLYATPEIERVTKRLPSMAKVKFPYKEIREGQSELVHSVYRTISRGGTLFGIAPTGTGKTVSVIFPAIRALGNSKCDKVFYLTPKRKYILLLTISPNILSSWEMMMRILLTNFTSILSALFSIQLPSQEFQIQNIKCARSL